MRKNQPQIYGTQTIWDSEIKKNRIYNIDDVKNVNARRAKLGLGTIEEHAEYNNAIFNQL